MLTALDSKLLLIFADSALETEDDLLGCLGLLVENWLGLSTKTSLLRFVSALAYRK